MIFDRPESNVQPQPMPTTGTAQNAAAATENGAWRTANVALITTAGTVFILSLLHAWSVFSDAPAPTQHVPARQAIYRIDINRASADELAQLPGIGLTTARRIVEDRKQRGPFSSIAELDRVRGIGARTLERLRQWVFVAPRTPGEVPLPEGDRRAASPIGRKLDINRASAEELDGLPRIGPVLAGRIIAARREQPFVSVDDLQRVPGIGPKTIDAIRPYVRVGSDGSQVSNRK